MVDHRGDKFYWKYYEALSSPESSPYAIDMTNLWIQADVGQHNFWEKLSYFASGEAHPNKKSLPCLPLNSLALVSQLRQSNEGDTSALINRTVKQNKIN